MHLKEEHVSSFSLLPLQNSALFPGLALGNSYIVLAGAFQKNSACGRCPGWKNDKLLVKI